MRWLILIATLPVLIGAQGRQSAPASGDPPPVRSCGAICDELTGAWSVTVAPPTSAMVACADARANRTAVTFPSEAIGLGDMNVVPAPSGPLIEFQSAGSTIRIAGSLDPGTLGVRFELQESQVRRIRCSGILKRFKNPGGSEGWATETVCESGTAGTTVCRLEPQVNVALLVQRILMEGAPSP